jgi:hypothetical protein
MRNCSSRWLPLVAVFFLVSCGGDKGTDSGSTDTPPTLDQPELVTTVDFSSDDQTAQTAQAMVNGFLGAGRAYSSMGAAFFAQQRSANWGRRSGDKWTWSQTQSGCTVAFEVVQVRNGYTWTYTLDGSCAGGPYDHWVVVDGTTNTDGTTGTLHYYEENSTTVQFTWEWTSAADHKSGMWSFYDGTDVDSNLVATMNWAKNADNSEDLVWENLGGGKAKWVVHVASDGKSGTMASYDWDDTHSTYWRQLEIVWHGDGTGAWTTYDEDGNVVNVQSWT